MGNRPDRVIAIAFGLLGIAVALLLAAFPWLADMKVFDFPVLGIVAIGLIGLAVVIAIIGLVPVRDKRPYQVVEGAGLEHIKRYYRSPGTRLRDWFRRLLLGR